MRRAIATILLVCFGLLLPTAAAPIRICFIEDKVLEPGFKTFGETPGHKDKCCRDCGKSGESCCTELSKLPDALEASFPAHHIPLLVWEPLPRVIIPQCPEKLVEVFVPTAPIRGPDSPGQRRALLEIWNI